VETVVVVAGEGELGSEYSNEDVRYELLGVGSSEIVGATGKGCHQREESDLLVTTLSGPPGAFLNTLTVSPVAYALFFVGNDANVCRPSLDSDAVLATVPSLSDLWNSNLSRLVRILSRRLGTTLRDGSKKIQN